MCVCVCVCVCVYEYIYIYILFKIITVRPLLNGISRDQNIFPLKPGFRLIKVHYI